MSTFVFTPARLREIRQRKGQICATLVAASDPIKSDGNPAKRRIRHLYREYEQHDADGQTMGIKRELVQDTGSAGELRPAKLTVLLVELVDVFAERATHPLRVIDIGLARSCGFKTVGECQADWRERHPRMELAKAVWFMMGDGRDNDRFLQRYIFRGGDYTQDRHGAIDDLPALSEEQLRELAANAQQRDLGRQAKEEAATKASLSLSERVARIESAGERMRRECRSELRIIQERTKRGTRKLK